jgi:hypothetical protein
VTGDVDMLKALLTEARAEVARLTAALTRSEEARREAEEHADRVERLGQIAVDNARDRAVAAEARASAAEAKVEGLREALRDLLGSHAAIYRAGAAFHETLPVVMKARALLPSATRDAGEGAGAAP